MNPEEIIHAYENGDRDLEPLLEKMGWKKLARHCRTWTCHAKRYRYIPRGKIESC